MVGNPKDSFSYGEAHIVLYRQILFVLSKVANHLKNVLCLQTRKREFASIVCSLNSDSKQTEKAEMIE